MAVKAPDVSASAEGGGDDDGSGDVDTEGRTGDHEIGIDNIAVYTRGIDINTFIDRKLV